jgi:hypothetical protein
MSNVLRSGALQKKRFWPWLSILLVLVLTIVLLRSQGRLWLCACGQLHLWAGDIWSSDNSQHLFDPYSFTHILHGIVFFWLLALIAPRLGLLWRLFLAISIEAAWELVENSAFVIQRYRITTAALGYQGDTIVNSVADILLCAVGFMVAASLGFRRTLLVFIMVEAILIIWIRDSLILNILMLVYPVEAIKSWQLGLTP